MGRPLKAIGQKKIPQGYTANYTANVAIPEVSPNQAPVGTDPSPSYCSITLSIRL